MAKTLKDAIDTFMVVTGANVTVAIRKLEEHGGNLNAAVNSHFNEGDRQTQGFVIEDVNPFDQEEDEDVKEEPLVRHTSRRTDSRNVDVQVANNPPSYRQPQNDSHQPKQDIFPSQMGGGISSKELDEAVIFDAAIFGGNPKGSSYNIPRPHVQRSGSYRNTSFYPQKPHPSSPILTAQCLLEDHQDDGYLEALQANREKELKAKQEEAAAREAALEREKRQEGEVYKILIEEENGDISSKELAEAAMLEAALFGGVSNVLPRGSYRNSSFYPGEPRPPSPTLTARRLLREEQDDGYLAALQVDREKELKAAQEEAAAREAAFEREKRNEKEAHRILIEEEELKRKLAAKQASLPCEPSSADEDAVTLLIRMPDGSRSVRRFLKSGKLQFLFDHIDVKRLAKPGTYKLVRPYPRQAFTDGESVSTLSELGLTKKHEALFLVLI